MKYDQCFVAIALIILGFVVTACTNQDDNLKREPASGEGGGQVEQLETEIFTLTGGQVERLETEMFTLTRKGVDTLDSRIESRDYIKEFFEEQGVAFSYGCAVSWESDFSIMMTNTRAQLDYAGQIVADLNKGKVRDMSKIGDY